jgi:hypothetical protein
MRDEKVSFNMIYEKFRNMWHVYHAMKNEREKEQYKKVIEDITDTIYRLHGYVPE